MVQADDVDVEAIVDRALVDWRLLLQEAGAFVPPEVERSLLVPAMRVAILAARDEERGSVAT
jgi:hypothetical protein